MSIEKTICWLFGHKKAERLNIFRFEDGKVSWSEKCPRCELKRFRVMNFDKSNPGVITSVDID